MNTHKQSARSPSERAVTAANDTVFLRERELLKRLPFSHATLWRRVGDGSFPAPVHLSPRVTAWRLADVERWSAGLVIVHDAVKACQEASHRRRA